MRLARPFFSQERKFGKIEGLILTQNLTRISNMLSILAENKVKSCYDDFKKQRILGKMVPNSVPIWFVLGTGCYNH